MNAKALVFLALSLSASAQAAQKDPCVGLYGFDREDCIAQVQRRAEEAERRKEAQQQLQEQLLREQIRSHQLQNEMLRRRLEADEAAKKQ